MFLLVFGRKYIYLAGFVILKNMNWEEHIRESIFFIILLLGNTLSGYADIPLEQLVDSLNVVLDNKQVYVEKKEQKIQAIKQLLQESNISILQEYDLNDRLYLEYKKFNVDSAMHYQQRNIEIALALGKHEDELTGNLNLSILYSMCGKYREAEDILKSISIPENLKHLYPYYYEAYRCYWEYYAISTSNNQYAARYEQIYSDSILATASPDSYLYKIHYAGSLSKTDPKKAQQILLALLATEELGSPEYAIVTCYLAGLYGNMGILKKEKEYYLLSTIADLQNATRENFSIQCLANIAYKEKNIDLAYKYTQSSIDDAMASNIHFRAAQMYHFYSVINTSYKIKAAKVKSNLLAYLAVACFLAVLLVLLLVIIYYQMRKTVRMKEALSKSHKKLKELNETLNEMNQELNKHNDSLMELNEVKEKYIAQFFELCSEYIDKMEIYQTEIYKLTINRHYEALLKRLKSTTFIDKELDSLYMHFDSIFLSLYPNFPDKFNALLEEKERVFPKSGHLLNKELRIYALLRLGVTDSAKIAGFLRCSMSTIYNYRTKLWNKALGNRDEFEEKVLQIGK